MSLNRKPALNNARSPLWYLLLLVGLLLALGCGPRLPEPARKLLGSWELSQADRLAERINQLPAGSSLPAVQPDDDAGEPNGPGMVLDFRADGTLLTRTALGQLQQQKAGTWRFVSASADGRVLAIRCLLSQQTTDVQVEFTAADQISLVPPNLAGLNTKLSFRRAQ